MTIANRVQRLLEEQAMAVLRATRRVVVSAIRHAAGNDDLRLADEAEFQAIGVPVFVEPVAAEFSEPIAAA